MEEEILSLVNRIGGQFVFSAYMLLSCAEF